MTTEQTDAALVREAAEKVMGWTNAGSAPCRTKPYFRQYEGDIGVEVWLEGFTGRGWNPLASDADAFMLVDKLAVGRQHFVIEWDAGHRHAIAEWCVKWDLNECVYDPDRRRAIVLACLKAINGGK